MNRHSSERIDPFIASPARLDTPLDVMIALEWQLKEDARFSKRELVQRDRAIGLTLGAQPKHPKNHWFWLKAWLRQLSPKDALLSDAQRWMKTIHSLLLVLGLGLGVLTALATFDYDGWQRINLLVVIAITVFLQLGLCLLTLIVMIPSGVSGRLPGLATLQNFLALFNAGQLSGLIAKLLPGWQKAWENLSSQFEQRQYLYVEVKKWLFLWHAQRLALAYHGGILLTLLLLISFQDLAFGWSSTLSIDVDSVHRLFSALAWPWHNILPQAVPDYHLIESSRYFRVQQSGNTLSAQAAQDLGLWWQFVVTAILFYGVLPRFLLWGFCKRSLYKQCKKVLRAHPEADGIYRRLAGQTISTRALEAEGSDEHLLVEDFDALPSSAREQDQSALSFINWAQIPCCDDRLVACLYPDHSSTVSVSHAGGGCDLSEEAHLLTSLRAAPGSTVVLALKSWEPPLAELGDFLEQLMKGGEIFVSLLPLAPAGQSVSDVNRQEWSRFVRSIASKHADYQSLKLLAGCALPEGEKHS